MKPKKRLDLLLLDRYPQYSRQQIQSWIMQGLVLVEDVPCIKPGTSVLEDAHIVLKAVDQKYVSRAGLKMEAALDAFGVDVDDLVILDAGLSTGGFSDCLLQRGARKIFGVDVGHSQVHEKIRQEPRVVVMERTNLRTLTKLPQLVDLVTLDLSFISVLKVMDAVKGLMKPQGKLIILIKPQFEAERQDIGKGGIIKDPLVHARVIEEVKQGVESHGFSCKAVIDSPIYGTSGNKEFLAYFERI